MNAQEAQWSALRPRVPAGPLPVANMSPQEFELCDHEQLFALARPGSHHKTITPPTLSRKRGRVPRAQSLAQLSSECSRELSPMLPWAPCYCGHQCCRGHHAGPERLSWAWVPTGRGYKTYPPLRAGCTRSPSPWSVSPQLSGLNNSVLSSLTVSVGQEFRETLARQQ